MNDVIRILGALAAGLSVLNTALLGYPGEAIPQEVIIIVGITNVVVGAMVAYLVRPGTIVYRREGE